MMNKNISFEDVLNAPSFLINLERRPERLEFSMKNLKNAGFTNIHVVKAVDGSMVNLDDAILECGFNGIRKINGEVLYTKGEIAATLSHLNTLKKGIEMNVPFFNIFEDDIEFHDNWKELAPKFMEITPNDWDLLYMGAQFDFAFLQKFSLINFLQKSKLLRGLINNFIKEPKISMGDILSIPVFCTHAFSIKKDSANRLINWLISQEIGAYVIDCMIIDGMKGLEIVKNYNFKHYAWHNYRFPSINTRKELTIDVKNAGLVFQNDYFGSDVSNSRDRNNNVYNN